MLTSPFLLYYEFVVGRVQIRLKKRDIFNIGGFEICLNAIHLNAAPDEGESRKDESCECNHEKLVIKIDNY